MRRLSALLAPLLAFASFGPVFAQDAGDGLSAEVRVEAFTPWNDSTRPFRVDVSIHNTGSVEIEDVRMRLRIYERVRSRSGLRAALEGRPSQDLLTQTPEDLDDPIPPGETIRLGIERELGKLAPAFRAGRGGTGGVYPVEIQVRGSDRELWSGWAALIYLSAAPTVALNVSWIIPVHQAPMIEPDGTYQGRIVDRVVGPGGSLLEASESLVQAASLPVTLAPTPRTLDELADLADGYERRDRSRVVQTGPADAVPRGSGVVLSRLQEIAASPTVEIATVPYARPDLVTLVHAGLDGDAAAQLAAGPEAAARHLGRPPDADLLYPAGLHLDSRSAGLVAKSGIDAAIVDPGLLAAQPGPFGPEEPVRLSGVEEARVDALLADPPIRERLNDPEGDPVLRGQAVLAETASSWFERPSLAAERALVVASDKTPDPTTIRTLAEGFAAAPWVALRTAGGLLRAVPPDADPPQDLPRGGVPDTTDLASLRTARRAVDVLSRIVVEPADATVPLQRLLMAAEAADFQEGSRGTSLARAAKAAADATVGKISAASRRVTLTSRIGQLPVTVVNDTELTIRVALRLSSAKVSFPEGAERTVEVAPRRAATVTVPAKALTAGAFGVHVELRTPDGAIPIGGDDIVVRSTAVSAVALVVIGGGLLIMLAAWFRRRGPGGRAPARRTSETDGTPQPA